jgi:hypothetical protein
MFLDLGKEERYTPFSTMEKFSGTSKSSAIELIPEYTLSELRLTVISKNKSK